MARKGVQNSNVTWHKINYEALHYDIYQDLIRKHHIPISDYAREVLQNVYQIPSQSVHIILNGVDDYKFISNGAMGVEFRAKFGIPKNATLIMGVAGRPWDERYRELAPNVVVLGAMDPTKLAGFNNVLNIFVNPTLRPQGLDLTLLEVMWITRSVIVRRQYGYTFSPNVASLIENLHSVIANGVEEIHKKVINDNSVDIELPSLKEVESEKLNTEDSKPKDLEMLFSEEVKCDVPNIEILEYRDPYKLRKLLQE
eukprot:Gb_41318 [translate_table: standard]